LNRIFEAAIILFNLFQASNNASIAASGEPNLTVGSSIIDICLFIPGVTASLIAFLVFGTTKSWRQYRDLVIGGCGDRYKLLLKKHQREEEEGNTQGLEFQRLPSIPNQPAEQESARAKELENRVRMFGRESGTSFGSGEKVGSSTSNPERDNGSGKIQRFHRPSPSIDNCTKSSKAPTSGVIEVGLRLDIEDEVIQYEQEPERDTRKLFMKRLPQERRDFIEDSSD
jgi:hypothetical protein